jgi:4-amino-4-deoxy-L-arabinose transferase-like glycosyltransferase
MALSAPSPQTQQLPESEGSALPLALVVSVPWLVLFHFISTRTWGHGVTTFLLLMGVVAILVAVSVAAGRIATRKANRWFGTAGFVIMLGCAVVLAADLAATLGGGGREGISDIAQNTLAAGDHVMEGRNPYAERSQLRHSVLADDDVDVEGGKVHMYGIPYDYGYPYFPGMFLAYLPFRAVAQGANVIRLGNLAWLLASLAGAIVLVRRLTKKTGDKSLAWWAGVVCLGIPALGNELFHLGVTDGLIAALAIWAFVALSSNSYVWAGLLLGLAQGCKLFPGPLLVVPVLLWLGANRRSLRVAAGYVAAAAMSILPWLAADWRRFLSSTVLYYLTHHREGDDTALYYFLPPEFQTVHLIIGAVLTLVVVLSVLRGDRNDLLEPLRAVFLADCVFMAFNRMTHLNYLWAVYPLGCAALMLAVARTRPAGESTTAPGQLQRSP